MSGGGVDYIYIYTYICICMWGERGPVLEWLVGGMWVCVCVYIYVYELVG